MRRRKRFRYQSPLSLLGGAGLAALAGFAIGAYLTQRKGNLAELLHSKRGRRNGASALHQGAPESVYEMDGFAHDDAEFDAGEDEIEEDPGADAAASEVAQRVLAAFMSDPVLARLPVEIGAESDGVVELSGLVESRDDREHAALIAGGVPGVLGVSNGIRVRKQARVRSR